MQPLHHIPAGGLQVAYHETGRFDGPAVVLVHGFPYDIHAYAEVVPRLAAQGCRVIVPTISLDGADDGLFAPHGAARQAHHFSELRTHRIVPGAGHNLPQEAPAAFDDAVLALVRTS
ncbi:MAG: hypothetical protein WCJ87_01605 [Burkholderiales bacterium]